METIDAHQQKADELRLALAISEFFVEKGFVCQKEFIHELTLKVLETTCNSNADR
jgi:hypothetical protein